MSYLTVKNGITGILGALGLSPSLNAVDFKNAPAQEYGNTFILKSLSGEQKVENIINKFDDEQEWQVQIAFPRSEQNDLTILDELHVKKDSVIKELDEPANWTSFVKLLKYVSWEVVDAPSYYVLQIKLKVLDTYTY